MRGDLFSTENTFIHPEVQELRHKCGWQGFLKDCTLGKGSGDDECPSQNYHCPKCKKPILSMNLLSVGHSADLEIERLDY